MKIIHTADWHLNDKLGWVDRTDDLKARVVEVAAICERERADVLVIAGDLFYERASREDVTESLAHLRATFRGFFDRKGTILAVTGNHDRDHVTELVRAGMGLAAPTGAPIGSDLTPGRMYLFNAPWYGKLRAASDDFATQFVMLPYPFPSRYLDEAERQQFKSPEEQHRAVQGKIGAWFKNLADDPAKRYDTGARTVFVAHMSLSGADLGRRFRQTEQDDVVLDGGNVPTWPDYVALGHIHKPQSLKAPHIRYAGPLDRLEFDEKDDARGVVMVEIGPDGRLGEPRDITLESTPMHEVTITEDTVTADELRAGYSDAATALFKVAVHYRAGAESLDAIERSVRMAFGKRLVGIDSREGGKEVEAGGVEVTPRADFRATVREYLEAKLAEDPQQREAILVLADQFMSTSVEGQE